MSLCYECDKRDLCTSLCPEAEAYVNQDEVSQRELNIASPSGGKWPEPIEKSLLTKRELQVIRALADGKDINKIATELKTNRENIKKIIGRMRKKNEVIIRAEEESD